MVIHFLEEHNRIQQEKMFRILTGETRNWQLSLLSQSCPLNRQLNGDAICSFQTSYAAEDWYIFYGLSRALTHVSGNWKTWCAVHTVALTTFLTEGQICLNDKIERNFCVLRSRFTWCLSLLYFTALWKNRHVQRKYI